MLNELETLSHLLQERIPAAEAFRILATRGGPHRTTDWATGLQLLERGKPLPVALNAALPRLPGGAAPFIQLTGHSPDPGRILGILTGFLRRDQDIVHRIASAAIYPLSVLLLGQTGGGLFLLWGLPHWLTRMNMTPLPFTTAILPWLTGVLITLAGIALPVFIPPFRKKIPFFGSLLKLKEELNLYGFLEILTREGYPLAEAVELCRDIFRSTEIRQRLDRAFTALTSGAGPTEALTGSETGTDEALWLSVAEVTGRTGDVLAMITRGLERRMRRDLRTVLPLVEPFFLLLTGFSLLPVLLSVLTPMLQIMERAG